MSMDVKERIKKMQLEAMKREAKENSSDNVPKDKRTITHSNKLNRAAQRLNIIELRLVFLALSQVNPVSSNQGLKFTVKVSEYISFFCKDSGKYGGIYDNLKRAADNLFDREWVVKGENGEITRNRWVSQVRYDGSSGEITLEFTPETMKELKNLRSQFTKLRLLELSDFSKKYSWRLFALFSSYKNGDKFEGWMKCGVKELREALDTPDSYNFGSFKRSIEQSAKEIESKRNVAVKIKWLKNGKRYDRVEFTFYEEDVDPSKSE